MRVMTDTNVIVSAVYNPKSKPAKVMHLACKNYELVLCDYIIGECHEVIRRKFPLHIKVFEQLLASLDYELVTAPQNGVVMSDPKDSPIRERIFNRVNGNNLHIKTR